MGNNAGSENAKVGRFAGTEWSSDNRHMTPEKYSGRMQDSYRDNNRAYNERSKSANLDIKTHSKSSVSIVRETRPMEDADSVVRDCKNAENFCNQFINATLKMKLNANLTQVSHFVTLTERSSTPIRTIKYGFKLWQFRSVQFN